MNKNKRKKYKMLKVLKENNSTFKCLNEMLYLINKYKSFKS